MRQRQTIHQNVTNKQFFSIELRRSLKILLKTFEKKTKMVDIINNFSNRQNLSPMEVH